MTSENSWEDISKPRLGLLSLAKLGRGSEYWLKKPEGSSISRGLWSAMYLFALNTSVPSGMGDVQCSNLCKRLKHFLGWHAQINIIIIDKGLLNLKS